MLSVVLIIPAALRDKANALAVIMGWGPNSYSVPLSSNGQEPISHYGLHTGATPEFLTLLQSAGEGEMPPELVDHYPEEDFAAVMGGLIASVQAERGTHWEDVLVANGLVVIHQELI